MSLTDTLRLSTRPRPLPRRRAPFRYGLWGAWAIMLIALMAALFPALFTHYDPYNSVDGAQLTGSKPPLLARYRSTGKRSLYTDNLWCALVLIGSQCCGSCGHDLRILPRNVDDIYWRKNGKSHDAGDRCVVIHTGAIIVIKHHYFTRRRQYSRRHRRGLCLDCELCPSSQSRSPHYPAARVY